MTAVIDEQGYRYNVGIVVCNAQGKLLWAKRYGMPNAWQFPQGGVRKNEAPEEAMYRELHEELGLYPKHVEVINVTNDWLTYHLPERFIRYDSKPLCIGQKQKWFLLRMLAGDDAVNLNAVDRPEFDRWYWASEAQVMAEIIDFKRDVYREMLAYFAPHLHQQQALE